MNPGRQPLVTTGRFEPLLGNLPTSVRIAPFFTGAVCTTAGRRVSQDGAGTIWRPMLGLHSCCMPQQRQPSNKRRCCPPARPASRRTSPPNGGESLGRLLNEPSFRQAAIRLRAEIERMPPAAAVLDELLVATNR